LGADAEQQQQQEQQAESPLGPQLPEDYIPAEHMQGLLKKGVNATEADFAAALAAADAAHASSSGGQMPPYKGGAQAVAAPPPSASKAEADSISVALQFAGVTVEEFQDKYADGAREAVAKVAGVEVADVDQNIKPAAPPPAAGGATGAHRRLLQAAPPPAGVEVEYTVKTPNRVSTLERLEKATADDGAVFTNALTAAGVPLKPAVLIEGSQRVAAPAVPTTTAPAAAAAAPAGAAAGDGGGGGRSKNKGVIIGAVVGAVLGALLLAGVVVATALLVRHRRQTGSKKPDLDKG